MPASLPSLSFEGATKKNKPNIQVKSFLMLPFEIFRVVTRISSFQIYNNYSPKWRWLVLDILNITLFQWGPCWNKLEAAFALMTLRGQRIKLVIPWMKLTAKSRFFPDKPTLWLKYQTKFHQGLKSRVVKSSRLPAEITTYFVSIGHLLCLAFLHGWCFLLKKYHHSPTR